MNFKNSVRCYPTVTVMKKISIIHSHERYNHRSRGGPCIYGQVQSNKEVLCVGLSKGCARYQMTLMVQTLQALPALQLKIMLSKLHPSGWGWEVRERDKARKGSTSNHTHVRFYSTIETFPFSLLGAYYYSVHRSLSNLLINLFIYSKTRCNMKGIRLSTW